MRGRFFNRIIVLVSISTILVIALGIYASRTLATLNEGTDWVVHSQRVQYELAHVLQLLIDAGSGLRQFETNHDDHSFRQAEAALADLPIELETLHRILARDPEVIAFESQLLEAAQQREKFSREVIELAREGGTARLRALIDSGQGRQLLERCRTIIDRMQEEENRIFEKHRVVSASARDTVAFAIIATTALAVLLLALVATFSLQHSARMQRMQTDLSTTLCSIGDAVISTDAAGRVRFMNPVAEQLTGWSNKEARGLALEQVFCIVSEQTRAPAESPVSRVLRERRTVAMSNHTILIGRDLAERPIEDSGAPIYGMDGTLAGVVLVFRDASAQRDAQRSLIDSEAALREADQRKDIFLATLSHELRNPLAPIRNAARLLESPHLSHEELERSRSIITRQVRHMASLLDDLLDVSRITRGMLTLKKEVVALKQLFEAAVESARPVIEAKRHSLSILWPPDPIYIEADPVRLTQIVTNLLTNAAKYTDPEGQISLGARKLGNTVVIYVRDNGIGLAPDMLSKVFDMFSQVAPDKGRDDGGLGIGLALVKGLIDLHGGSVEAISAGLERGSEFVLQFPNALSTPPAESADATQAAAHPSASRPLRILVADDNRDSAESLGMLLELSGHEVLLAHDGLQALAIAAERLPDAALLDIGMPGMDGYEVATGIRRESWGTHMTLIAITGWGQEEAKRLARHAGFDHHLTKPMDGSLLEALLSGITPRV